MYDLLNTIQTFKLFSNNACKYTYIIIYHAIIILDVHSTYDR